MAILRNATKMLTVRVKKALDCASINSVTIDHQDLEFLNLAEECGKPHFCCFLGRVRADARGCSESCGPAIVQRPMR